MTDFARTLPRWAALPRTRLVTNLVLALVLLVLTVVALTRLLPERAAADPSVPQSAVLERDTGVRISRVAVVGDGGLLTVSYVVLDPEAATRFQADRDHPPLLRSEARDARTQRVSIMRAGHQMRAGQTYYLVYDNAGGVLRPGETVSISYDGHTLRHVPVV